MGPQIWFEVHGEAAYVYHPHTEPGCGVFVQHVSAYVPERVDVGDEFFDTIRNALLHRLRLDVHVHGRTGGDSFYYQSARVTGTPDQRAKLARLLGQFVRGEHDAEDLVDRLQSWESWTRQLWVQNAVGSVQDVEAVVGVCGHWLNPEDGHRGPCSGDWVCSRCVDRDLYVQVEDQSGYHDRDNVYWHESSDSYYTYPEDDDYDDERSDDDDDRSQGRYDYSTNVMEHLEKDRTFESTPSGPFHIGVELEVCAERGCVSDVTDAVYDQLGRDFALCKRDSSIDDYRDVEIVTAPRQYQEQIERLDGLELPRGTTAWDARTCGMHVHVSSKAFTKLTLGKFMLFWNSGENTDFIRKVAGRHPDKDEQAADYAMRLEVENDPSPRRAMKVHPAGASRYQMVNLCRVAGEEERDRLGVPLSTCYQSQDDSTVELRIFRASLRKARMFAQIEMAAASVYFCRDASWSKLHEDHFTEWLSHNTGRFQHLARYLGIAKAVRPRQGEVAVSLEEI
jgi:hypothetical protein